MRYMALISIRVEYYLKFAQQPICILMITIQTKIRSNKNGKHSPIKVTLVMVTCLRLKAID